MGSPGPHGPRRRALATPPTHPVKRRPGWRAQGDIPRRGRLWGSVSPGMASQPVNPPLTFPPPGRGSVHIGRVRSTGGRRGTGAVRSSVPPRPGRPHVGAEPGQDPRRGVQSRGAAGTARGAEGPPGWRRGKTLTNEGAEKSARGAKVGDAGGGAEAQRLGEEALAPLRPGDFAPYSGDPGVDPFEARGHPPPPRPAPPRRGTPAPPSRTGARRRTSHVCLGGKSAGS